MATVTQLPAALNYQGVAGNPATFIVNFTITDSAGHAVPWSSITGYEVEVTDQFGNVVSNVSPSITSPSAYTLNIGWTAEQTSLISEAQNARYAISIYVTGVGPYAVTSGALTMSPPEYPASA